ncbi:helicase-associated domain-containing protein [Streptomyces sp. VRA16 Mangrove soil]|uniref:helicase-associated domain-containing protein n=1 Tax=Streptomyces sp. VRA16 Mangrove soil TaxID=2817434 RepID=UPI001A9F0BF7|nr:helicase-associated domain-containing protein [Streptomyces sp. VRA16 Mangrove soil]MBO1337340.1 helicase-associated domain-containing protein [Streptomyces sp. VRA16 Mangrove soil]
MKSRSTLATWLSRLDSSRLARVLAARKDAASSPEPRSLGELADRLQRPGAVALVLPQLTLPCLQVAEALAALGARATRDSLAELLGSTSPAAGHALDTTLEALSDRALVWHDSQGTLHMPSPLRQAWSTPLGLEAPLEELLAGTTSEELRGMLASLGIKPPGSKQQRLAALVEHHSDAERVAALVARAPAATRKLLEERSRSTSCQPEFTVFGSPGPTPRPDARWALDRGLLLQDRRRYGPARMPAEVALALRGPDWHAPFEPLPPVARTAAVSASEVEREAAVAGASFVAHAARVLSICAAAPLARLKSGGIGARELARLGKAAQADDAVVRIALETAYAAGLLARDGDRIAPTEAYDAWTEQEPAEQLAVLLRVWRDLPLTPTRARDADDRALPALAGAPPCGGCVQARHGLLTAAAGLPAGQGVQVASELGPLVGWHRPLADDASPEDTAPFSALIREAELLGVLARGALSPFGVHLAAHADDELDMTTRRLLPPATTTARIGADLTAVVTGTPSARLAALLDSVADLETRGTASVWRFSAGSVRRALDAGRTPDDITADLANCSATALPQPLTYLIADTARGHGRVRIAPAACVIHGDEPALLAELAAHRALSRLGLRQLAPTVLVSSSPPAKTLAALRSEGYAPVAETAEGTVRIEKLPPQRAAAAVSPPRRNSGQRGPRTTATRTPDTPADAGLDVLAERLLKAPPIAPEPDPFGSGVPFATDTEEIVAGYAKHLSYSDVRQVAHAIDTGAAITVEYIAASGNRTVRTLSDLELDPPYLDAWCHLREAERVFTLSRIHGVMPA